LHYCPVWLLKKKVEKQLKLETHRGPQTIAKKYSKSFSAYFPSTPQ